LNPRRIKSDGVVFSSVSELTATGVLSDFYLNFTVLAGLLFQELVKHMFN